MRPAGHFTLPRLEQHTVIWGRWFITMCDMLVELRLLVMSHQAIRSHPHLVSNKPRLISYSSKTVMGTGLSDSSFLSLPHFCFQCLQQVRLFLSWRMIWRRMDTFSCHQLWQSLVLSSKRAMMVTHLTF